MTTFDGTVINSYINSTCNLATSRSDLFNCVPKNSLLKNFRADEFMTAFNTQFKVNMTKITDTISTLSVNYTIYIVSFGSVRIDGT